MNCLAQYICTVYVPVCGTVGREVGIPQHCLAEGPQRKRGDLLLVTQLRDHSRGVAEPLDYIGKGRQEVVFIQSFQ